MIRPWAIAALVLAVDAASKRLVQATMTPGQSLPLIAPFLHLTYVRNTGMAFGLFRGFPGVFALLAGGVIIWIVTELGRSRRMARPLELALALILGGAVGNLVDRVRLGYVVDFIDLRVWPVFNLADSAITIGVACLLWQSLFPGKAD